MGNKVPEHFIQTLRQQVVADPGLPRNNPTVSYWQLPPHGFLSEIQSSQLAEKTDYAIIGSGVSGLSIAKHVLEHAKSQDNSVTVFEARTLTSGASGRNGGGLASHVPYIFSFLVEHLGKENAIEIAKFTYRTLEKMHELGNSNAEVKDASEIRRTREVQGFLDMETFEATYHSFRMMCDLVPETNLNLELVDPDTALNELDVKTVGGLLRFNSGAFWPYRFVTAFWDQLYKKYGGSRLHIEAKTPVTDISVDSGNSKYPYILKTPRGIVRSRKVIHATNGYSGHLLAGIRGKLFPMKGFMSAQQPGSNFEFHGTDRTWSFFGDKSLDPETGIQETGVYYGNQSPKNGVIFWGTDKVPIDDWLVADDETVHPETRKDLSIALPKSFRNAWPDCEVPKVEELWTGIMGYTADHLPLVGKLPTSATGRDGDGEFISAGFNGAGMCQIWSSGEAVVKVLFGEDVKNTIPNLYLVSEARLNAQGMTADGAVASIVGGELNH